MSRSDKPAPSASVILGTGALSVEQVVAVARFDLPVTEVTPGTRNVHARQAFDRLERSRAWVERLVEENAARQRRGEAQQAYYGINTGFGAKSGRKALPGTDIPRVSRNLVVSHATGVGAALHPEVVRAAMLIRANSLALGYSGVRPVLVNTLVRMLNRGVIPLIPEYGSLGASGDLIPLSHLALVLSRRPEGKQVDRVDENEAYDESGLAYIDLRKVKVGESAPVVERVTIEGVEYAVLSGSEAMRLAGIERLRLEAKEGLALNNGATFSAAIAALALHEAENLLRHAEIAAALSLEALLGFRDAFLPHIQKVRGHPGQIGTAERIISMLRGSNLVDGDEEQDPRWVPPQDAYSLRAAPPVIGAAWDVLGFSRQVISREINAATDNPLIFDLPENDPLHLPRGYRAVSGANFHGAPLAYVMDFLGIVVTDVGSLSERRTFRLTDPKLNTGLPSMLIEEHKEGLTSGMMVVQYLAASLVSDCKTLAHPDSVDSIPTSANQEDHVSMSMNAARHTRQIVENITHVVSIELLCAALGLKWRVEDLCKKLAGTGDEQESERPGNRKDEDRSRVDEKVIHLKEQGMPPTVGKGSQAALACIEGWLYPSLPRLGEGPATEDRFLQPYVLRMARLVRACGLVEQVYAAVGLPVPEHRVTQ